MKYDVELLMLLCMMASWTSDVLSCISVACLHAVGIIVLYLLVLATVC